MYSYKVKQQKLIFCGLQKKYEFEVLKILDGDHLEESVRTDKNKQINKKRKS